MELIRGDLTAAWAGKKDGNGQAQNKTGERRLAWVTADAAKLPSQQLYAIFVFSNSGRCPRDAAAAFGCVASICMSPLQAPAGVPASKKTSRATFSKEHEAWMRGYLPSEVQWKCNSHGPPYVLQATASGEFGYILGSHQTSSECPTK